MMASIHNCLEFFDGFEFLDGFDSQQPRATSTASSDLSFNSFTGLLDLSLIDGLDWCDLTRFVAKSGMSYSSVTQRSDTVVLHPKLRVDVEWRVSPRLDLRLRHVLEMTKSNF